ncbi:MAG: AmmeMemoRadiSam system protein A [Bacillota bacterium]|nr:AmmeMemoRadiSam system protein A [Bacillota bacterium]
MTIQGFYLMPHPPIVIPEVGRGEEEKISATSDSMYKVGEEIARLAPDTIVIVSPHGTMFGDAIALAYEDPLRGSLKDFRAHQVSMEIATDKALTNKIFELASEEGIPVVMADNRLLSSYNITVKLDHGVMVPLYFINKYYSNYKLVHITYAPLGDIELYKFGEIISKAVKELGEKVVFIASGDLSHRLKDDGPYDYHPHGEKFDREFLQLLQQGDVLGVFNIDRETVCDAGECGRRSVLIMLGALEGFKFNGDLLSYEGTFGVGYGIVRFNILSEGGSKLAELEGLRREAHNKKHNQRDSYVRLARQSLTTYITTGRELEEVPEYVTAEMREKKRGVFVSLKKYGELRGCIGTFLPTTGSIAEEIMRNAIEAGLNDPRFGEVEEEELLDIDFSVDVLEEPVPAQRPELDPKRYGVIVSSGRKRGLLLPDLEGVDTVDEQLSIACQKAGIRAGEDYTIEKFEVVRHTEE